MRRFRFETPQGDMAALEFGDPAGRLAALWLHATGFNAMTYQSILAPLGLRTKVQAVDLRGHGRTTLPANPKRLKSWKRHRNDVIAFLERQAPTQPVVLAGHSMGATVALLVAGAVPNRVAGLVLVDPVILPPAYYRWMHLLPWMRGGSAMVRQAKKRRNQFGSQQEVLETYQQRSAFKTWRDPFLSDYIIDGFDRFDKNEPDSDDQDWRLLCTPSYEAATFAAQRNRPWGALAKVRKHKIPVTILRPERNSVLTDKVAARLSRKYPDLVLKERVNTTHFLPMEAPYDVRDQLSAYISSLIEGIPDTEVGAMPRSLKV